jgi:hypothetical protein
MGSERERSTFLTIREVLERTLRYTGRARQQLIETLRDVRHDARTQIFLATADRQREELEAAIERSCESATAGVLETRAQYTVEPWQNDLPTIRQASIEEAVSWLLALDEGVLTTYRELASGADNAEVRELFESLVELVTAHDQQLARESQTVQDL